MESGESKQMKCPGSDVEITVMQCPRCGEDVEFFTGESKVKCAGCGNPVTREKASCIEWCPGAKQCFHHVFEEEGATVDSEGDVDDIETTGNRKMS
ncbi:MAG: hypothetical protein ACYDGS_04570 [Thermoleophilia bacterium]